MRKSEVNRLYKFSDSVLVTKSREKLAFMTRDAVQFATFGITETMITALGTKVSSFSDMGTDVEAVGHQTMVTEEKAAKAEMLRVAIRNVMARVERKYKTDSARYRLFGISNLSKLPDSDLLVASRRVVRVGTEFLEDLTSTELTAEMLEEISDLCEDLETLLVDLQIKMGERDIMQEDRVEAGNAIYSTLVSYTTTGRVIWETSDVAKYNDYIIYDTVSGEASVPAPEVQ